MRAPSPCGSEDNNGGRARRGRRRLHAAEEQGKIRSGGGIISRRSVPNPRTMKGFFRSRKKSDADQDGVVDTARKVSIDHTMLSRDEHARLVAASGDFSRSSDADSHGGEIYHPSTISAPHASNGRLRIVAPAPEPPNNMTASRSDPSFLAQYPDGYCRHQAISPTDLSYSQRSNSHPMQPPAQLPTSQQLASQKAQDPALQARIEAIRIQQQLLGDNHPDVIFALSSLGKLQQRRGNHAEAASILSEARMRSQMANSAPQLSSLGGASSHSGQRRESPVPTEISFSH